MPPQTDIHSSGSRWKNCFLLTVFEFGVPPSCAEGQSQTVSSGDSICLFGFIVVQDEKGFDRQDSVEAAGAKAF